MKLKNLLQEPNGSVKLNIVGDQKADKKLEKLLSYEITDANIPEKPDVLLKIDNTEMFTVGDISAVVGQAGHGKSLLLSMIATQMMNNTEDFFTAQLNGKILWFDTEQSEYDVYRVRERIRKSANVNDFHIIRMRELPYKSRKDAIFTLIDHFKPKLVVIDGITDIISSVLDEEEAKLVVEELSTVTSRNQCHILGVIHQNEGGGASWSPKARGHIGSEWTRKAEGIIQVSFKNKKFHVQCMKGRHGRFDEFTFEYDNVKGQAYFTGQHSDQKKVKDDILSELLHDESVRSIEAKYLLTIYDIKSEFSVKKKLFKKSLVKVLRDCSKDRYGVVIGENSCRTIIDNMVADGTIIGIDDKNNILPAASQQITMEI